MPVGARSHAGQLPIHSQAATHALDRLWPQEVTLHQAASLRAQRDRQEALEEVRGGDRGLLRYSNSKGLEGLLLPKGGPTASLARVPKQTPPACSHPGLSHAVHSIQDERVCES